VETKAYTRVTRKGQITLPAAIRRQLGLKEGDRIEVTLTKSGKPGAVVRPAESVVDAIAGSVRAPDTGLDFGALRREFGEYLASRGSREQST
jgi:AbrB family looped-hinge helix DNA binding protein